MHVARDVDPEETWQNEPLETIRERWYSTFTARRKRLLDENLTSDEYVKVYPVFNLDQTVDLVTIGLFLNFWEPSLAYVVIL